MQELQALLDIFPTHPLYGVSERQIWTPAYQHEYECDPPQTEHEYMR